MFHIHQVYVAAHCLLKIIGFSFPAVRFSWEPVRGKPRS